MIIEELPVFDLLGVNCAAGLDSGAIITHVVPRALAWDPFVLGMEAIRGAHLGLCNLIMSGQLFKLKSEKQDPSKQIRCASIPLG